MTFDKEVGDLIQQLQLIQPIQTQKIQVRFICGEAFCNNLLITMTNLTVKFTYYFQGITRSFLDYMILSVSKLKSPRFSM
ncbi:unnamed protein product [Hymenolepis diminuta]|uniref:Uncharacterized protein n=1 Tax=Hymenolepis diminuta TaxID=6216 RepID=A0A564Z663_HYMDI|nr:unnamed protein product [Hymenolepis diminuta]